MSEQMTWIVDCDDPSGSGYEQALHTLVQERGARATPQPLVRSAWHASRTPALEGGGRCAAQAHARQSGKKCSATFGGVRPPTPAPQGAGRPLRPLAHTNSRPLRPCEALLQKPRACAWQRLCLEGALCTAWGFAGAARLGRSSELLGPTFGLILRSRESERHFARPASLSPRNETPEVRIELPRRESLALFVVFTRRAAAPLRGALLGRAADCACGPLVSLTRRPSP